RHGRGIRWHAGAAVRPYVVQHEVELATEGIDDRRPASRRPGKPMRQDERRAAGALAAALAPESDVAHGHEGHCATADGARARAAATPTMGAALRALCARRRAPAALVVGSRQAGACEEALRNARVARAATARS